MGKAEEFRKKFGQSGNTEEIQLIYNEIEKIGNVCQNYVHHGTLLYATIKELKTEGFRVEEGDNCYTIYW
jgi:hypothetical protein